MIEIYSIGSFVNNNPTWCFTVLHDGNKLITANGKVIDSEHSKSRNIAGEIYAACHALKWCAKNNHLEVTLYHRMELLEKLAYRENSANSSLTMGYLSCLDSCGLKDITFIKMKASNCHREEIKLIAERTA